MSAEEEIAAFAKEEQCVKDAAPSEESMKIAATIPFGCGCCSGYNDTFITKWIAVEIDAAIAADRVKRV